MLLYVVRRVDLMWRIVAHEKRIAISRGPQLASRCMDRHQAKGRASGGTHLRVSRENRAGPTQTYGAKRRNYREAKLIRFADVHEAFAIAALALSYTYPRGLNLAQRRNVMPLQRPMSGALTGEPRLRGHQADD
jgi:hypothetical protein